MNIYFAGAIRGGRSDAARYAQMIGFLQSFGEVVTEHVGHPSLTQRGDDGPTDRYIHDRDMQWLTDCELVVAEVTVPSLGVGYELGWACALKKPVLCLYRPMPDRTLSAMIGGSAAIQTVAYSTIEEGKAIIRQFIDAFVQSSTRGIGPQPGGGGEEEVRP